MTTTGRPAAALRPALLCLAAALAAGWPAGAEAADDDLARRTFANAEALMQEGKVEQALRDFERVAEVYADSAFADDALYRIGSYYYPVETVGELGTADRDALLRARRLLVRIKSEYPGEDSAPKAMLKLGLIAMDPVNPDRDLDEAYADFSAVVNIYPSSDVIDRALFGAAFSDLAAGRLDKAIATFQRIVEQYPRGASAEDAAFQLGEAFARKGAFLRALEHFQQVRNEHPEGRLTGRALDRLTLIYKTKILPELGVGLFAHDGAYKPALDPDAARGGVSIAIDSDSIAHLLYARSGAVARLRHDGKVASNGRPLAGAISIAVDAAGDELIAAGESFRIGSMLVLPKRQDRGGLKPMTGIEGVARLSATQIAVLDADRGEILVYEDDPANMRLLFRDSQGRARLTGLAVGAEGTLYTIDRRGRRVLEIPASGPVRPIHVPAPSGVRRDLAAIAADDVGNLYLIDERNDAVLVMNREGELLQQIVSKPGTAMEFSRPAAIAVGPRGEIYVYDEKRKTILRFW